VRVVRTHLCRIDADRLWQWLSNVFNSRSTWASCAENGYFYVITRTSNIFVQDWRISFIAVVIRLLEFAKHLGILRCCLLAPRKTDIFMPSFEITLLSENILNLGLHNSDNNNNNNNNNDNNNNNSNVTCRGVRDLLTGFWLDYWTYWHLIHAIRNYRQLQRYRSSTHFTVHRYIH
jgi:hypothetical protein